MKKINLFLILIASNIFLGYLPFLIELGEQSLAKWQADFWTWNYIGTAANYIVFVLYLVISREPKERFGLHLGRIKQHAVWLGVVTIGLILLMRGVAYITEGSLYFQIPPFTTIFFQFLFVSFAEELFWRGLIQTKFGFWTASIGFGGLHLLTGLLFLQIDLGTALAWGAFAVFMGFVLGWVRIKTDSVYACALVHGLYNLSNYVLVTTHSIG